MTRTSCLASFTIRTSLATLSLMALRPDPKRIRICLSGKSRLSFSKTGTEGSLSSPTEKSPGAEKYEQVINKRGSCEDEKEITSTLRNHCTPCAEILLRLARSLNCFIAKQENSKKRAISPSAL